MIELNNVSFSYGRTAPKNGLHEINLTIRQGEVILLCGESGCGKTTLTRLINGLIPHYYEGVITGEVLINGRAVRKLPLYETAIMVGSVFQNPRSQFFNVDTTSELAFACENQGLPVAEISKRVMETARDLKIEVLLDRSIFQLSGGEKQKIACASVAASQPDVYVLDEPTANLDLTTIEELRRLIKFWKDQGKTIIIAEHRLYFLRELADRVLYLKDGRIVNEFTMGQLTMLAGEDVAKLGLRPLCLEKLAWKRQIEFTEAEDLRLTGLVFTYRNRVAALAVDSLTMPRGGVIAVIGNNGAGKSTFARCLCGLERGCRVKLLMDGRVYRRSGLLKQCYLVMQDVNHQLFTESVLDEILLGMAKPDPAKAETILAALDLLPLKDRHPMSLSGGQKQRVAIAGAVATGREVIVFDEPTSGLDLRHMEEVSRTLRQLQQMGKTLLIISHDIELILNCCTHVLHLENGSVVGNYSLDCEGAVKVRSFFIRETN
jgi:energy-coupling factor transporter ATP-binding protein EcfA2